MSEQITYPEQVIKKAVALARKYGRETDSSRLGTGPVVRRAEFGRFTVEFGAVEGSGTKAKQVKIFLDDERVFSATFEPGWENDLDRKLLHWGPRQEWRPDFMAIPD